MLNLSTYYVVITNAALTIFIRWRTGYKLLITVLDHRNAKATTSVGAKGDAVLSACSEMNLQLLTTGMRLFWGISKLLYSTVG